RRRASCRGLAANAARWHSMAQGRRPFLPGRLCQTRLRRPALQACSRPLHEHIKMERPQMRLASRLATLAPIMLSSQHSAQAHQAARLPKARCVALLLGAWMLAALPAQAAEVAVTVSTLDGKTYTGKLQQLADDALKVATTEGVQSVPLANLLALTPEKQPEKAEPTSP